MTNHTPFTLFSQEERQRVWFCLEHYRQSAERGKERMKEMLEIRDLEWIRRNITYWSNVESGLRWVQHYILPPDKELASGQQTSQHQSGRAQQDHDPEAE